jgi:pimeloyl-ACP methyl ester carboxylesterase
MADWKTFVVKVEGRDLPSGASYVVTTYFDGVKRDWVSPPCPVGVVELSFDLKDLGIPRFRNQQDWEVEVSLLHASGVKATRKVFIPLPVLVVRGIFTERGDGGLSETLTDPHKVSFPYTTLGSGYPTLIGLGDRDEDNDEYNYLGVGYEPDGQTLEEGAERLRRAIARVIGRANGHDPLTYADRVDIVAHSKGGLVARMFLRNLPSYTELPNDVVRKLVMACTPHTGAADIARIGDYLARPAYLQLLPTSPWYRTSPQKSFGKPPEDNDLSLETLNETAMPPSVAYYLLYGDTGQVGASYTGLDMWERFLHEWLKIYIPTWTFTDGDGVSVAPFGVSIHSALGYEVVNRPGEGRRVVTERGERIRAFRDHPPADERGFPHGHAGFLKNEDVAKTIYDILTAPGTSPDTSIITSASAVAVVMDRSGSMEGEKLAGAKRAADSLFGLLPDSASACLVTFASGATTEVELIQASPANKVRLRGVVGTLEAGGYTNITAGLINALTELQKPTGRQCEKKGVFLLSDGMHNTGIGPLEGNPSIVDQFAKLGIPIHTIGYGTGSSMYSGIDSTVLTEIARRTGGEFWWGTPYNLTQVYHKINAHLSNRSVLVSYNDLISNGKQLSYEVAVDKDVSAVTFFADWQGSTVDLELETPSDKKGKSGTRITPSNFSSFKGVTYTKGDTYCAYTIANPTPGTWRAILHGTDIPQGKEQVNLTVSADSPLVANILSFQPDYQQGQHIAIKVKVSGLLDGGEWVKLKDVKVTAKVRKPTPRLFEIVREGEININIWEHILQGLFPGLFKENGVGMFDDGGQKTKQKYDEVAGDGIFSGLYTHADTNGVYLVTVTVEATTPTGQKVTRVLRESLQIGPIEDRRITLSDFLRIRAR